MLSGEKPAAVIVSRKGVFRLFQVGTLRPCLSLPSPVSTTIRRVGVSTTSEWIDILSRPSSVAKCGMSQGDFLISSLLASGRINRVLPTVSSSTIFVILTLPTFQNIRRFPNSSLRPYLLGAKMRVSAAARNGSSRGLARWSGAREQGSAEMPELAISIEKVGFLIEKMREFDVKEGASDPDSGSNSADDMMIDVLEDNGDDPVVREITEFINAMTEDEQIDLVALMRLGRGDGGIDEWDELRREAADGHNDDTAGYLLGEPLVRDYLAEGAGRSGPA